MMPKVSQLVFMVGSGRSGTTLLRNILEHHPSIGVTPELRFFDLVMADKAKFRDLSNTSTKAKFIERIFGKISKSGDPLWGSVNLRFEALKAGLSYCNSHKEIFLALAQLTSSKKDPDILIEKTPGNIFFLEEIIDFFPEAKFIHALRDGREFCASAKKRNFAKKNINLAVWWKEAISAFDKIKKKFPQKRKDFLEIKYEDLVKNPEEILNLVFSFLGLGHVSEDYSRVLKNLPAFSSFSEDNQKGLYQSRHFKSYFSLSEQKEIESLLFTDLKKHGYLSAATAPAISLRLKEIFETMKLRTHLWFKRKGYFWLYCRLKKYVFNQRV